jgi:hypothetical protein
MGVSPNLIDRREEHQSDCGLNFMKIMPLRVTATTPIAQAAQSRF